VLQGSSGKPSGKGSFLVDRLFWKAGCAGYGKYGVLGNQSGSERMVGYTEVIQKGVLGKVTVTLHFNPNSLSCRL
jgi:hypothetical protein